MHPLLETFYTLTGILIIFFLYCRIIDIFKLKKAWGNEYDYYFEKNLVEV